MGIDPNTMNNGNFPKSSDTTEELIRKHKIYKREWDRIVNHQIKRGRDYWGGYDDSIANDLSEVEELLYQRAYIDVDYDARAYIYDNGVPGTMWVPKALDKASDALDALNSGNIERAKKLLESIKPNYPTEESDDE